MNTKEAALLYQRIGKPAPADISAPATEHVRNTRRKMVDGIPFRSTLEADVYQLLKSWQAAGVIRGLECQPRYLLQPAQIVQGRKIRAIEYVADFRFERDGRHWVIDAKGYRMEVYRIKAKLFRVRYTTIIFEEWDRQKLRSLWKGGRLMPRSGSSLLPRP